MTSLMRACGFGLMRRMTTQWGNIVRHLRNYGDACS
jgi:hypothetical protein